MKKIKLVFVLTAAVFSAQAQNISVNTTGAANSTLSMLEVLQISTTASTKGLHIAHSGAITGTGYGIWSEKTGASTTNIAGYFSATGGTNNYALIVPASSGFTGIGTSTPTTLFHVDGGTATTTQTAATIQANSLTSGIALDVTSSGTLTGNLVRMTGNSATTGNLLNISGTGLTSGNGVLIQGPTAGATLTGNLLRVATASTGAAANGFIRFNLSGAHTGNGLQIDDATATGNAVNISGTGVTTGRLLNITTSGNTWTGNATTNGLANISSTSTAGTASGSSILLYLSRSGANASTAHNAYGIRSTVTNTNATSGTNLGGYFSASGATTYNYGAYGISSSTNGDGIEGINSAATNAGFGTGVYGSSLQTNGAGVWGDGGANTAGVYGSSASKNVINAGVYGQNSNTTNIGTSWNYDQVSAGVAGRTTGTVVYAAGVYGYNNNSTVNNNAALFGQDGQAAKAGMVFTYTPGAVQRTMGLYTELSGGVDDRAVEGIWNIASANDPWGYIGGFDVGVYGAAGTVAAGRGVWGNSTNITNSSSYGVFGQSGGGVSSAVDEKGVVGNSSNTNDSYGYGVSGTGEWYGVYGRNPTATNGYGVYYSNNLAGTGTKSCVVRTSKGPTLLYCQESPENLFEDFGSGELINGKTVIKLDPLFLETVTIDTAYPFKVFLQFTSEFGSQFYVKKHNDYFEVIEANGGTSNATFDWRLVAKRKGYEDMRLENSYTYDDPMLYPDPNDPSIPVEWRKKVMDAYKERQELKNLSKHSLQR